MIKQSLISIIIPCYNVENYVSECLSSVLSQTYENLDIIIINDGSTDKTEEVIKPFLEDKRIRYFYQENQGLSVARNTGLDNIKGDFICFLDSDDFIHQDYVKLLYNTLIKYDADISICDFMDYYEEHPEQFEWKKDATIIENTREDCFNLINQDYKYVVVCNKLYKAEIFNDLRFVPQKIHEDEFIIHHIYWKVKRVVFTKNILLAYRQNPNGITKSLYTDKKLTNAIEAYEDRIKFYKKYNIPNIRYVYGSKWGLIHSRGLVKHNMKSSKEYILKNPIEYWKKGLGGRKFKIKIFLKIFYEKIKETVSK